MESTLFNYVWVIDDNTIDNYVTDKVLKKTNLALEVSCFTEATMALLTVTGLIESDNKMPEVIFLDISMPVMNGFDFLEAFKKIDFGKKEVPKIIMLSSSTDQADMSRAMNNPLVSLYLSKPITVESTSRIRDLIDKSK